MDLAFRQTYGNKGGLVNTFIGGIASVINTPDLLAAKLENHPSTGVFLAGNIKNFKIVGNNIECSIKVDYTIKSSSFSAASGVFPNTLTHYYDNENYCKRINNYAFWKQTNFKYFKFNGVLSIYEYCFANTFVENIELPSATYINAQAFIDATKAKRYYLPSVTNLGGSVLYNQVFFNSVYAGMKIYINPSMATVNAGSPDGDLTDTPTYVSYIQNTTKPNPIANLSIGTVTATTIQLNFTAPTGSANAIDFYEVWINGFYQSKIINGGTVTELTANTLYNIEVKPVDIFYNKSYSNTKTQQTTV